MYVSKCINTLPFPYGRSEQSSKEVQVWWATCILSSLLFIYTEYPLARVSSVKVKHRLPYSVREYFSIFKMDLGVSPVLPRPAETDEPLGITAKLTLPSKWYLFKV